MKFYSTQQQSPPVDLKEAVIRGMPADKGLYMPELLPRLPESFFRALPGLSLPEIAWHVSRPFLAAALDDAAIRRVIGESITFETPLVAVGEGVYALELFHGPTLAFKDVGARFMARLMGRLLKSGGPTVHILAATSGDTGSAVARGFYDVPGIHVTILYPSGKISAVQEQQIATLDKNISSLEVDGTFDDCQRLVKSAFLDEGLRKRLLLSSANSINIGRLLPQTFYYFYAAGQLARRGRPLVFSVPSGNFGNLTAGLIAWRMGLPVSRFVAAVNANATFPTYLQQGTFHPAPSIPTLSNAMDVGNPSNLGRIVDLFKGDVNALRRMVVSRSYSDEATRRAIREIYRHHGYIPDPHGAVGWLGLTDYMRETEGQSIGVFLETAHPAKFGAVVEEETGRRLEIPPRLASFMGRKKTSRPISACYEDFKEYLLSLE